MSDQDQRVETTNAADPAEPGAAAAAHSADKAHKGDKSDILDSPALAELYDTLATAQAGIHLRREEIVKDLKELDAQDAHWQQEAAKAHEDEDLEAEKHAQQMLRDSRTLRNQLMQDLGPKPEEYGVQPEQTLDTPVDAGATVTRSIDAA